MGEGVTANRTTAPTLVTTISKDLLLLCVACSGREQWGGPSLGSSGVSPPLQLLLVPSQAVVGVLSLLAATEQAESLPLNVLFSIFTVPERLLLTVVLVTVQLWVRVPVGADSCVSQNDL